jgi:SAM-dependent methyltransferase
VTRDAPEAVPVTAARLRDPRTRLVLTSGTLLFVELLLIRWIPSEVRYVGFFSNFVLMASFLGIGIGILLGRRLTLESISVFPILLAAVVWLVTTAELNVQVRSPGEIFFGLAESNAADANFLVLPIVFVLVTALMASLSLPLSSLFRSMPPLRAYAFDVLGSMLGIVAFVGVSAAGTPPVVWFYVVATVVIVQAIGTPITIRRIPSVLALIAVLWLARTSVGQVWSPYYRIDTFPDASGLLRVNVNGIPHQALHPVAEPKEPFYEELYKWFPDQTYGDVLVVGAGTGTDIAIALSRGADHVDAVEIDPGIQQIGRDLHPDRPYQDPRVTAYENDGRAFLRSTDKRYDLIIFALPDSLTLISSTANIRLESFLFTEEAFASVRDHLAPDGIFVLYNYYREPWLIAKIGAMLEGAFGTPPILRTFSGNMAILADGPAVAALAGTAPPGEAVDAIPAVGAPTPRAATDDWPFLYLRTPFVAPYYLLALAFVLGVALVGVAGAARLGGTSLRRFSPHFFVLGTAFLLLETRSLVSFSLLFGSTWLVNALAFFAILASVLLAILLNARLRLQRPGMLYGLLFAALLLAFLVPPESLLIEPAWLRYVLAGALAFAPVFLANLVFTYSFRDTQTADMAFASNLLGAMVGGALEYMALITGYRALLIVVAILYAVAWLFATRFRRLSDVELRRVTPSAPT